MRCARSRGLHRAPVAFLGSASVTNVEGNRPTRGMLRCVQRLKRDLRNAFGA